MTQVIKVSNKRKVNKPKQREALVHRRTRTKYLAHVEDLYGPQSLNPVKAVRTSRGLTISAAATEAGISSHGFLRTEQGFFPTVPDRIKQWSRAEGLGADYIRWQRLIRDRHLRVFGDIFSTTFFTSENPLDTLYDQWSYPPESHDNGTYGDSTPVGVRLNDTEFSKLLCLNQSTVYHWHERVNSQQTIPNLVMEALRDNGYSNLELSLVSAAYTEYRHHVLGRSKVRQEKVQTSKQHKIEQADALTDWIESIDE